MSILHSEVQRRRSEPDRQDTRRSLVDIFAEAISKSLHDIGSGANVYEFQDLAVIHTIVDAAREGYDNKEIHEFIARLSEEEKSDQ